MMTLFQLSRIRNNPPAAAPSMDAPTPDSAPTIRQVGRVAGSIRSWGSNIWALLILLLAAGLRFHDLAGQSLWSDEGNSLALASSNLQEIAARTALDIHPPLYYWLLHAWLRLVGGQPAPPWGEAAARSLSAFASILLVAVVLRLGKRLFGARAARAAALVAAISPFQVYYAQEARMYALLALLGGLAAWSMVEVMARPPASSPRRRLWWQLLYVCCVTLGMYTQYAFPVVLAATGTAGLLYAWHTRRQDSPPAGRQPPLWRVAAGWLLLNLIPLLLFLPWLPTAWRQLTTWPAPSPTPWLTILSRTWHTLVLGPVNAPGDVWGAAVVGLLAVAGLFYLLRRYPLPVVTLVLLYLGLPVVLTLVLFKPAYLKFLLVATPPLYLLLGLGLAPGRLRPGRRLPALVARCLAIVLVVVFSFNTLKAYFGDPSQARDDYRGIAYYLEAVAGPQDAIILNAAGQQEVFGYYYRGDTPVYPMPQQRPLQPDAVQEELETIAGHARNLYAIFWATDESDPEGFIEGWMDQHTFKATESWVGNLRFLTYATPLPAGELVSGRVRLGDDVLLTGLQVLYPGDFQSTRPDSSAGQGRALPGDIVQVQLRWETEIALSADYIVFVQALDAANHLVGQRDAPPSVPTSAWIPGQPVLDRHGLLVLPGTPPGECRLVAGLYDPNTGQRLAVSPPDANAGNDSVDLGTFLVQRPPAPPPLFALDSRHPTQIDLGPLRLLGYDVYKTGHSYDPDTPLLPGDPLHVVLWWQAQRQPETDLQVALRLYPAGESTPLLAEGLFPAAGVGYPTTTWQAGEVVRAQFDVFLPPQASPGTYAASLLLLDSDGTPAAPPTSLGNFVVTGP